MRKIIRLFSFSLLVAMIMSLTACDSTTHNNTDATDDIKINFYIDNDVYDVYVINEPGDSLPTQPTNSKYDFAGWFLDNEIWEQPFELNDLNIQSDVNVYGAWKLRTPSLSIDENGFIVWDEIDGADSYIVSVNEYEVETLSNNFQIPLYTESERNILSVKAISDNTQIIDSDFSFSVNVQGIAQQLDSPNDLSIINNTLYWEEVKNTVGYKIQVGNQSRNVGNVNEYNLTELISYYGDYEIEVTALGDGNAYSDSEPSTIEFSLSEPTGTGTKEDPYILCNYLDFLNFIQPYSSNSSTLNKYYELGNDIDLGGIEIKYYPSVIDPDLRPVRNTFQGFFDGKGHTISNFKISRQINEQFFGLFAGENEGIIQNVGLTNYKIELNQEEKYVWVGSIVGRNSGHIINCFAEGEIIVQNDLAWNTDSYTLYVGGLVGAQESVNSIISDSHFIGDITVLSNKAAIVPYVGGILGKGGLINCYVEGNITLDCNIIESSPNSKTYSKACYVGGLLGSGTAEQCYANANVTAKYATLYDNTQNDIIYLGGLVGDGEVVNCYSSGLVTLDAMLQSVFSQHWAGDGYAGGLVGAGEASKSYSLSTVYVVETEEDEITTPDGLVEFGRGYKNIGGLAGNPAKINDCISIGNIGGNLNVVRFGRIVGYSWGAEVNNSYFYDGQLMCGHLAIENLDKWALPDSMQCDSMDIYSKEFYTDTLNWDEDIWDFTSLNAENSILPTLK